MTLYTNSAEGGTQGTEITVANSGGASGTAFSFVNRTNASNAQYGALPAHGNNSLQFACATGESAQAGWQSFSSNTVVQRIYFRANSAPASITQVLLTRNNTVVNAAVAVNTAGKLFIQDTSITLATAPTALTNDTYYRLEFAVTVGTTTSNGAVNFACYVGDSTTAFWTYANSACNTGTTPITLVRCGKLASVGAWTLHFDDYAMRDDSLTFFGPVATTGSLKTMHVYTSGAWTPTTLYVRSGGSWIAVEN